MRLALGDGWNATVTDDPLLVSPRFTGNSVEVAPYASVKERERFIAGTFGSQDWLWDTPDVLRFDPDSRKLVGAEFQMPYVSADAEVLPRARGASGRAPCGRDPELPAEDVHRAVPCSR